MLIQALLQKYQSGCNKGIYALQIPGLLNKLNSIIKWKPYDDPEIEKKFEHKDTLSSGDCFLYNGQVIAVDNENQLVLIVSETGPLALDRIVKEHLLPEYELKDIYKDINSFNFKLLESKFQIPEVYTEKIKIDSIYQRILKEHCKYLTYLEIPTIEFIIDSDVLFMPITIFYKDNYLYYNKEELIDEDLVKEAIKEVISGVYNNIDILNEELSKTVEQTFEFIMPEE